MSHVRVTKRCLQAMCAHKIYLLLVIVPYLFLLLVFHLQLQISDHSREKTDLDPSEVRLLDLDVPRHPTNDMVLKKSAAGSFHFRDLMLKADDSDRQYNKQTQLEDPRKLASGKGAAKQNSTTDPPLQAIRLELEGASDVVSRTVRSKILSYYNDSISKDRTSVVLPLTDQCWEHFKTRRQVLEDSGLFHYLAGGYILSAFLDGRILTEPPFVRITALLKRAPPPELYCHFAYHPKTYPGQNDEVAYATELALFYEMCENHNKDYGGWIISCKVPSVFTDSNTEPCEVILSRQPELSSSSSSSSDNLTLPIFKTTLDPAVDQDAYRRENFAVCVPPLFGHIPSTTLVEFVELSKLIGAGHIVFYVFQVTSAIQQVLEYYEDQGVVSVVTWDVPVRDKAIWYHGQLLAINDCLYRTMHRFTHVVFNDIDEFVVPNWHDSWSDMARYLESGGSNATHKLCGYTFQSAFFDPLVNGNSKILYDLESDLRTKSFSAVRTKVMVRPQWLFELGIHHISRPLSERYVHGMVEPDVAFVHHYRRCMMDYDPRMKCQVYARDESLFRHIPALRHNVHETLWVLKEIDKMGRKPQPNKLPHL